MWLWVAACAGLPPITAQLPVYLIFCVCKQPFYDITWAQPADMCWLVQRGKKTADFAGQGGAKLFILSVTLALVQPVDCLFGFAGSKLTPNHCGAVEHDSSFCFYIAMPPKFLISSFVEWVNSCFGLASLGRAFAIGGFLQRHLAAWQSPLCTSDTDMSNLLQAEATIRQGTAAGRDLFPKLFLWGILLMQHKLLLGQVTRGAAGVDFGCFPDSFVPAFHFWDW